jgi:hypothetical protein
VSSAIPGKSRERWSWTSFMPAMFSAATIIDCRGRRW